MPELPDVEAYCRRMRRHEGHRIEQVRFHGKGLGGSSAGTLRRRLAGARIHDVQRHGKWLLADLDDDGLLALHFGMTGDLVVAGKRFPDHTVMELDLDDGTRLAVVSVRRLGKAIHAPDLHRFVEEHDLGPDALRLDEQEFVRVLQGGKGMVKPLLMDQSRIAGLGNVYTDEALFRARIHPRRQVKDLDEKDLRRLHRAVREVARRASKAADARRGGVDPQRVPDSWLLPHRGPDEKCPRCGNRISAVEAAGRRGWACEACAPP